MPLGARGLLGSLIRGQLARSVRIRVSQPRTPTPTENPCDDRPSMPLCGLHQTPVKYEVGKQSSQRTMRIRGLGEIRIWWRQQSSIHLYYSDEGARHSLEGDRVNQVNEVISGFLKHDYETPPTVYPNDVPNQEFARNKGPGRVGRVESRIIRLSTDDIKFSQFESRILSSLSPRRPFSWCTPVRGRIWATSAYPNLAPTSPEAGYCTAPCISERCDWESRDACMRPAPWPNPFVPNGNFPVSLSCTLPKPPSYMPPSCIDSYGVKCHDV